MQLYAHNLSSKIIFAHMNKRPLDLAKVIQKAPFHVTLFDKDGAILSGNMIQDADLSKPFSLLQNKVLLVDKSTFGHLGVDKMLIGDDGFFQKIDTAKHKIILILLLAYLIVSVSGYFLARLFIQPMQMRRIWMDNFIKESTHELNTPIAALLMSVDAKKEHKDRHDERIKISAKRISDIYKDLTYLFLRDGVSAKTQSLDVGKVCEEQVTHIVALASIKKITITQKYENPLIVQMDKESLIRLLSNLLSNAVKYNKSGGKIEVSLKDNRLSISDTGIGIAKEKQEEIYTRFYRATDQSGGFGLGLNIVDKICKQYHIKIDMHSTLGEGTSFILTF